MYFLIALIVCLIGSSRCNALTLSSDYVGNIFCEGKPVIFYITLGEEKHPSSVLNFEIRDYKSKVLERGTIEIKDPNEKIPLKPIKIDKEIGKYLKLYVTIEKNKNTIEKGEISFGLLPEKPMVKSGDITPFGAGLQYANGGPCDKNDVDLAAQIGITWIPGYGGFIPESISNTNEYFKFNWFTPAFWGRPEAIATYMPKKEEDQSGVWENIHRMAGGTRPRFRNIEDYEKYVRKTAEEFKGVMGREAIFTVGHEVSFFITTAGFLEKYIDMVKRTYKIAKETDPNYKIYIGALCYFDVERLKELFKELENYSDGLDFHPTSSNRISVEEKIKMIKELYSDVYHRPVFIGEMMGAFPAPKEIFVAEDIPALYTTFMAHDIKFAIWLWYRDMDYETKNLDHAQAPFRLWEQCLLNRDYTPRMAYFAYYNMARFLIDARFTKVIDLEKNVRCYLFKKGDHELVVSWYEAPSRWAPKTDADIKITGNAVKTFDIMGNELEKAGNDLTFKITRSPVYILGDNLQITLKQ